jgi:menaquinone-dependent protoporphyrinogen oxidase
MTLLVAYASKHGATEGITGAIAERLRERGMPTDIQPVTDDADLRDTEAVVLGSAIYLGAWMKEAVDFAHRHAEELVGHPVWLFSSGPLGAHVEDEEEQPRQLEELRGLLTPIDHRVFFGASTGAGSDPVSG